MSRKRQREMATGAKASRTASLDGKESAQGKKGAFLVRQFGNVQGRLLDGKGRSTALALSAKICGEPVPKNSAAARKLAKKGKELLARSRRGAGAG